MKIIFIVLFAILIAACAGLMAWRLFTTLQDRTFRILMIAGAAVIAIVMDVLLILAACIPSKANKLLGSGIESVELRFEESSPGSTTQVLSTDELKAMLAQTGNIKKSLSENSEVGGLILLIGTHKYLDYLEAFSKNIDENLQEMEAEQIPVTIHNVLQRIQVKSGMPIRKVTKGLEIAIIVIAILLLIALWIVYIILKKDQDDTMSTPRVLIVDQGPTIERGRGNGGE